MIEHFYTETATLYYVTESVSTDTGENIKTNSTGTVVSCKVRPLTNYEKYIQNKNNYEVNSRLYCAYSTLLDNVDRVSYNSETYEITSITNPFMKNDFLQVDLRLIK